MPRRLTIAICVHGYFPEQFFGTAVYVRQFAQALQRLGHRPVIVTVRINPEPNEAALAPSEWLDGIEIRRVLRPAVRGVRDTFDDSRLIPALEETFRSIAPDIVHVAHFLGLTAALYAAARTLDLPVFATLTDFHGFCHRGTLLNSWERPCSGPTPGRSNCVSCGLRDHAEENPGSLGVAYLASWFARPTSALTLPRLLPLLPTQAASDIRAVIERPAVLRERLSTLRAAFAPTQFLRDAYRRNGFTIPIEVCPFGIDADRTPKPKRHDGPLRIGFIGQIGKHKGCHVLVEAARHLDPKRFLVEIWGDMARHPLYAGKLLQNAAGHPVQFRGSLPLEALDVALRSLDVLVMPSIWAENSPLTLLQALACHTPCIVSNQPGMTEVIMNGENGLVVPTGSYRALAATLRRLEKNRDELDRLTQSTAYERDTDHMAIDVLNLYSRYGLTF